MSIIAATEPSLRDNVSLRQKGLLPVVRDTSIYVLHLQLEFIIFLVRNFFLDNIGQGTNASPNGSWGLHRLLLIYASC